MLCIFAIICDYFRSNMARYKAIVEDIITIDLTQEDGDLITRYAKVAEGLLAEEVVAFTAKGFACAWTRFREYDEERRFKFVT